MIEEKLENSKYRYLIEKAKEAMEMSYSPYSHFCVGAALEDDKGRIWTGCNIENASFGATNCAERTAIFKAVSQGVRSFRALAIVGKKEGEDRLSRDFTAPCGICRQVLSEFCSVDMPVILTGADGLVRIYSLAELLPLSFGKKDLEN